MAAPVLTTAALTALLAIAPAAMAAPSIKRIQHEYDLSDYEGDVDTSFANVAYDPEHGELFVIAGSTVSIFRKGLKVFQFETDPQIGLASSVAPLESGELLVASVSGAFRCNFRGRLIERFTLKNAPAGLADFRPNSVHRVAGKLYLASTNAYRVVVAKEDGTFIASYDLAALAFNNKLTDDHEIGGFSVDPKGNLLFTVPALFKAYIVSPDGQGAVVRAARQQERQLQRRSLHRPRRTGTPLHRRYAAVHRDPLRR